MARLRPARGRLDRLRGDESGSTSVEFALVAMPFFFILCAVMAAALQILAQQTLDDRLDEAGRALFTGAFQRSADPNQAAPDRLKTLMCAGVTIFPCGALSVEVTAGTTFGSPTSRDPYDARTGTMTQGFGTAFTCPTGDQVVTVRVALPIPSYFGVLNVAGRSLGNGRSLLTSTAVFRTEPFAQTSC